MGFKEFMLAFLICMTLAFGMGYSFAHAADTDYNNTLVDMYEQNIEIYNDISNLYKESTENLHRLMPWIVSWETGYINPKDCECGDCAMFCYDWVPTGKEQRRFFFKKDAQEFIDKNAPAFDMSFETRNFILTGPEEN